MEKNKWQHLSDKRITSLLVGSTYVTAEGGILWQKSRYNSSVKIRMPKMSVERIEQIGKEIGVKTDFTTDASQKLSQLINACHNDGQKVRKILKDIFGRENFQDWYYKNNIGSFDNFTKIRSEIWNKVIKKINERLYFHCCELVMKTDGPYLIKTKENWVNELIVSIPDVENINEFQINDSYKKINEDGR